jgi:hypothetical protein
MTLLTKNSNLIQAICEIYILPVEDVSSVTATNRFNKVVTLLQGKTLQQLYFTPGTAELVEKPKETDAGLLVEQSLKFLIPGEDSATFSNIDAFMNRPLLVFMRYSDNNFKLMGDTDNGAKLSQLSQISSKQSGSQLELSCSTPAYSCWVITP